MLYIFDLGNVIVDIDFNRVLGAWSDLTRIPLASLKKSFHMGEAFHQHERGEISDEAFAEALCHEMALPLSYEQFSHGWQAVFVALRPEVIAIMHKLREQGHRVVVLSNTNRLHTTFWPEEYPEIRDAADHIYLSQDLRGLLPFARRLLLRELTHQVLPRRLLHHPHGCTHHGHYGVLVQRHGGRTAPVYAAAAAQLSAAAQAPARRRPLRAHERQHRVPDQGHPYRLHRP